MANTQIVFGNEVKGEEFKPFAEKIDRVDDGYILIRP
jgi:hypothetical protein